MSQKLEAKAKDSYKMGPVIAFSGHEFVHTEWRAVPAGFEAAAIAHPLLDVRDAESQEEIHVTSQDYLADTLGSADVKAAAEPRVVLGEEPVTTETEPGEEAKPAKRRSRRTKASEEDE
jgi:hypothetical protein